jgi:hypothetical protein
MLSDNEENEEVVPGLNMDDENILHGKPEAAVMSKEN